MTAPETARFGQWGERMAAVYLRDKGYEILARNFRTVRGELDIVAARDGTIVFVEVKSRRSERFVRPADAVTEAFLNAYPDKQKKDALYIDTMIRQPILKIMRHKAAQGGAPVYAYLFSWESPLMNGVYMSYHTAEIPFVFHNTDKLESRIGGSREAERLADRMSDAWIRFARTGV